MEITPTARAGRREWIGLGVLALPTMVLSMDLTVLHLAAPSLSADLAPTGNQLLWILDIYGFMVAGFLLLAGNLGDQIGRRRLLLIGAAAFAVASTLAAFADSVETLIAARALLGIAGATLMPSTLALLTTLFRNPAQRGFAVAVWMTCFTAGEAIGPLVGGVMLEFFWWGSIFLIGVPVMAVLLVVGPMVLPEAGSRLSGRVDMPSAALLLGAMLPLVYSLKAFVTGDHALSWLIVGLAAGAVFVRRQLRISDPMMELRLFRYPAFSAAMSAQLLAVMAVAGVQLLVLQYLQGVGGLSPLEAGLWTAPSIVLGVVVTLSAPRLARQLRGAVAVAGGLGGATVGAVIVAFAAAQHSSVFLMVGFTVLYVGVTPTLALLTDLIVGSAPAERAGMAAGVSEMGAEFGLAGGVALLGSVAAARYRSVLDETAPEEVVLSDAADTVGGAIEIAGDLPGRTGEALAIAVRESFAAGVELAAVISAAVLVLGALVVWRFLIRRSEAAE